MNLHAIEQTQEWRQRRVDGVVSTPSSRRSYGDDVASISTQLMMTAMFRLKLTMKSTPKAECTKILKSQFYQRVWSAQLNEAEYAPLLTAVLLYLNSEGVAAPLASTLAVGGQVIYFWLRAFVGHYHEGGMDPPPYAPFAVVRYIALGLLVQELRGLTA